MPAFRILQLCLAAVALLQPGTASAASSDKRLVVTGVTLLDPGQEASPRTRDATLVIADETIVYAGPSGSAPPSDGARVIDGTGLTAFPGLTDMHVHVWDEAELGAYLAHGVTSVRNMSGMPFHLELAQRIARGELDGPRLLTSGPILNSAGANQQINHQIVETAQEARAAVAAQHAAGFTRLKTYSNLRREAYEAIRDEAAQRHMLLTGHAPEGERRPGMPRDIPFSIAFEDILDDGFETIEHVESILWHGLADQQDDTAAQALALRIAQSGTPITPTLLAHHNLVMVARTKGAYAARAGTETLNPVTQQTEAEYIALWSRQEPTEHAAKDLWLGRFTAMLDEAGVTLVTGSDAGIFTNIPGQSLHDELALMVRGGMSPIRALRASTSNVADVLDEDQTGGCLSQGCRADIVLTRCDPAETIRCSREIEAVIARGRYHDRQDLDTLLESARHPNSDRTLRNLMAGMEAQGTPLDPATLGM
ncbi:amidohydrolase family protein [Novosphingobium mangrovi (ex Hu et al. 2023)]|uniref:Amidohydrolase family protein n=1 Tax=Novosphingobium mangrovi (ex Hu et al. 2023) TaxID=2930094 RepID=A0ABT0AA91_9SPHN|nr:amidohydrolase family protein [Novosphingobium mangrovi (ex Hu et al. 2023)]MCJ1960120.1 amidohydrolase family protein [Novosphingobium mangrovi (ex Hu et al. 2023)]